MKKKRFMSRVVCALLACVLLLSAFSLTAAAAPGEPDDGSPVVGDDPADSGEDPGGEPDPGNDPDNGGEPGQDENPGTDVEPTDDSSAEPTVPDDPDAAAQAPTEEPDDDDDEDDAVSTYEPNEHLNELPEVDAHEVVLATAVQIPHTEVSDASLMSGLIMWLCVAVGIAVVVGVMVSKRIKRRGS